MRRLVGGLVCVLVLGGAALSTAQEPAPCRWTSEPGEVTRGLITGVVAPDASNVWAVGSASSSRGRELTLVRHWDGTSWETQPSPNVKEQSNRLNDVAVAADGTVWAVGHRSRTTMKTVVQRYDGTSWRMQRSLNPSKSLNSLDGVDVTPSGDVWAVGSRWNSQREYRTMIHRFDGTSWSLVSGRYRGLLWDVDAITDTDVWAVGSAHDARRSGPFALHFDGTGWTPVEVPGPDSRYSGLFAVSAAAPDDVWAVGTHSDDGVERGWIAHYDGTAWSQAEIPDLEPNFRLLDVSALDGDTAVAVGESDEFGGDSRLVLEWDGTSWTRAEQDDNDRANHLWAVALAPDGEGWAAGYHSTPPATEYVVRRTCR